MNAFVAISIGNRRQLATYALSSSALLAATLSVTGVPLRTALLLTLLVIWQTLGGFAIWRSIRPHSTPLELFGMGIAIGSAMAALAGLLTSTLGWGPWGCLAPTLGCVALAYRNRRRLPESNTPTDPWEISAFLATLAVGLAVFFYALRNYPLTWSGTWTGYHRDMAFFEALANSLATFGAFESPFMSGGLVRYHWLSYAWSGQLSAITDAAPFVGTTRVLPLISLLGSAAIVVAWTRRMSPSAWTPFLAGALLTVGGFVGAVFGGILTLDSPSQALSTLWLLAFTVAAIHAFKELNPRANLLLLAMLAISITIGKVSAAAPALAGVLAAALVLRARRNLSTKNATQIVLVVVISMGISFAAFIAGAAGGGGLEIALIIDRSASQQGLNPLDGPRGVVLGTLILILAIIPRWAGVLQLLVDRTWRWRPETWISIGMITSSLLAVTALSSFNELWFSVSTSGPLAATSAVGVALAVSSLQKRGRPSAALIIIIAAGTAILAFAVIWWAWSTGASGGNLFVSTQRWVGPLIGVTTAIFAGALLSMWATGRVTGRATVAGIVIVLVLVAVPGRIIGVGSNQIGILDNGARNEWFSINKEDRPPTLDTSQGNAWTSDQVRAAEWLRANTQPTDLVATNLTYSPLVAGLSHRPTYASGIQYQYDYGTSNARAELLQREKEVWEFLNQPSTQNLEPLCTSGVKWIWIQSELTHNQDWTSVLPTTFASDGVAIAEINEKLCSPS